MLSVCGSGFSWQEFEYVAWFGPEPSIVPVFTAISKARMDFRKTLLATSRKLRQEAEKNKKDVVQEIEEEEQRILEQVGIAFS